MARINIDTCFFSDERIDFLSQILKENRLATEARLIRMWASCYRDISDTRTATQIGMSTQYPDSETITNALIKSQLVEDLGSGEYRVRGIGDRINYLRTAQWKGKRSAEARRKKYGSAKPVRKSNAAFSSLRKTTGSDEQNPDEHTMNTCSQTNEQSTNSCSEFRGAEKSKIEKDLHEQDVNRCSESARKKMNICSGPREAPSPPLSPSPSPDKAVSSELEETSSSRASTKAPIENFKGLDPVLADAWRYISQSVQRKWVILYGEHPGVKWLERELIKALEYLDRNPRRKPKSPKGWSTYMSSWLGRSYEWQIKNQRGQSQKDWRELAKERGTL